MINKLHERSPRITLNDYSSDFNILLENNNNICNHHRNSAGNNILNPGGRRDQIIPLFDGHFKFRAVSWYMPKNPVGYHGWETKNILQFRLSKTAFPAIFQNILFKNIASFFF